MHESQRLRELMELQWNKRGMEYTGHTTKWRYSNGCLWPDKGKIVSFKRKGSPYVSQSNVSTNSK